MNLFAEFMKAFFRELAKPSANNIPHDQPSWSQPAAAGPRRDGSVVVGPDTRPLWQIRGWQRNGDTLTGVYRTPRGSFVGKIEWKWGQMFFLILNPPVAVLRGPHGACFRPREDGWHWVHFGKASNEIDSGLVAIEVLLHQALRGRG